MVVIDKKCDLSNKEERNEIIILTWSFLGFIIPLYLSANMPKLINGNSESEVLIAILIAIFILCGIIIGCTTLIFLKLCQIGDEKLEKCINSINKN